MTSKQRKTPASQPKARKLPLGWILGVVSYPYAGGIFEFLRLQVFGSGLSPDIEVGREWKPYSDAWFLVTMAGTLFIASGSLSAMGPPA